MPHTEQWGIQRCQYGPTALLSTRAYQIFKALVHDAAKTLYQLASGSSFLARDARSEQGYVPL